MRERRGGRGMAVVGVICGNKRRGVKTKIKKIAVKYFKFRNETFQKKKFKVRASYCANRSYGIFGRRDGVRSYLGLKYQKRL